jgi:hypothetical protein
MAHYNGSCHCGAVKYSVELELGKVINTRCLDGVDIFKLDIQQYNGKDA